MISRIIVKFTIASCIVSLYQCSLFLQEDCPNNLDPYFNKTITYKNNEVVEFINDSGIQIFNTVHIKYPDVPETYINDQTDQTHFKCSGSFEVTLGDYSIDGVQFGNFYNNFLQITTNMCNISSYAYQKQDTTIYMYNNTPIQSIHFYEFNPAGIPNLERYCIEYYVSAADLKILYYSIVENTIQTNWRVK